MGSTFFGLNTALTGLTAQQKALYTVTHNLTNAGTDGYTRQRVTTAAAPAFAYPGANTMIGPGQMGTGVEVKAFTRMRDQFIDVQFRQQVASLGQWEARGEQLDRVNQVINEPSDSGLASALERFWSSWHSLSLNPESASAREAVRSTTETLASTFHGLNTQLTQAQTEADSKIADQVARVNQLAGQIVTLNQQIAKVVGLGQQPNDLMDERDRLVDEVGKMALVTVSQPNPATGKLSLSVGGQLLVDSTTDTVNPIAVSGAGAVTIGATPITLTDGSLRGFIDIRDSVIGGPTGYLAQLDNLANALISAVNAQHAAGFALDGTTGNAFLAGAGAAGIALAPGIVASLDKIAASGTAADVPGGSGNAVALAQLRNVTMVIGGTTTTIDGYYQATVSGVGVDADQAFRMALVQKGVTDATANRRDAVSGVNMDEELSDMVKFQKSYNAAARMITTIDEMLEMIVNRMGLVGR
jgi:flagellar hook-associated protein 1 FlgK